MASRRNNPNNAENLLFKGLTRLLSGPIVNYRRQNPRQLKRLQLDKFKFKSASGQPFKKVASSPLTHIYSNAKSNVNRAERYIDFEQMTYMPEIASALDIYADEMTTSSPLSKLLNIQCPNEEIKGVLDNLFYNVLNIENNIFGWCRDLCQNGDKFMYLDIDEKLGVTSFIGLPIMEVERLEGQDKTNPNYVQFQWNTAGLTLENWQVAHFRILGQDKFAPYGTSVLDAVRRIWRQLQLQEDAMMAYRIVRSPERRVFYVDVGGINEKDVEQYMQKIVTDTKRNQIVDPDSGQVDLRYNPMSVDEDYYLPVIGGQSATRIETLPGGTYTGDIDDVKYLRDKMMAGLKIPQSYLITTDGAEDKETLSQKDIRFARTIQRLQRSVISELEKIAYVHLFILGYRDKDLISFKLGLNNPSKIAELQELEHWKMKFDVAASATEGYFSRRWVAKKILNISDEEFLRNTREMFFDAQLAAQIESIANAGELSADEGGGLGGELGDMGDEGGAEGGSDEDDVLLAAPGKEPAIPPGKRHDFGPMGPGSKREGHLTPGSNGKVYHPERSDKRVSGARKRHMLGMASTEKGKNTFRNVHKGGSGLRTLSHGIFEEYASNYKETINEEIEEVVSKNKKQGEDVQEETQLMENDRHIQNMIESLEKDDSWKEKLRQMKKIGSETDE